MQKKLRIYCDAVGLGAEGEEYAVLEVCTEEVTCPVLAVYAGVAHVVLEVGAGVAYAELARIATAELESCARVENAVLVYMQNECRILYLQYKQKEWRMLCLQYVQE